MQLDSRVPSGPIEQKWDKHRFEMKLVNPANKRKYTVLVVGSGLAGASAAATLSELGYNVRCFCFQDSPRRAHSIAAQGGINAAKNYRNDGDSIYRLFYDTVKGGDFRAREANVYRLAQISVEIIDQCVAQGVPFAREYGGLLANRSFGGAQVSRTFYARGQTGQQLLLGAYQALEKEIARGGVQMFPRTEMLDLIVIEGRARGIVVRDLVTGKIESHLGDAVVLGTGGYGNVFYLSTNAKGSNVTAIWRAHKRGAAFGNPCYTQIHPTCIPVSGDYQSKLTLMSESLRNDGRIWVPQRQGDTRPPARDPGRRARLLPRAPLPELRQPGARATSPPARPRQSATRVGASGPAGSASTSTSPTRSTGWASRRSASATAISSRCISGSPTRIPTRPADADLSGRPLHHGRALGGLQPDEHHPRPARDRRGELLRPRRQPARRQRPHAGARGRLLHPPEHRRRLSGVLPAHQGGRDASGGTARGGRDRRADQALPRHQGQAHGGLVPPRARQDHVGQVRHGAECRRLEGGAWPAFPSCARSSGRT